MGTGYLELISNSFAFVLGVDKVFDLLKSRYLISQISNFVLDYTSIFNGREEKS
jgi:hypothetical protein